ncbi:MAG: acetyltransferase [Lachnospiraceae bacterium]|nr:acetyltransferase [Lachnospiraceae bacterium]
MKNIVIVGNGGFAKETKWLIEKINTDNGQWNFYGYIDKNTTKENVLGDDEYLLNICRELFVVIAIGSPQIRMQLYEKYEKNKYIRFPNLIDPTVSMADSVKLGKGNIICAGNIFTVDIGIGDFNIINLGCTVGHDVKIGNFNTINPGTNVSGNVTIGNLADIGTGTKIIQGKRINNEAVVGAGAVVIENVPFQTTVVGVPAKAINR